MGSWKMCFQRLQMGYFPLNHDYGRKGREFLLILFENTASLGWASARIFSAWKKAVELPKTRGMMHDCDEKNAWPSKGTAFFYSPIWVKNSLRKKCFKTTMTGFHHHHLWLAVLVFLKYIFLPWLQATTTKTLVAAGLGLSPPSLASLHPVWLKSCPLRGMSVPELKIIHRRGTPGSPKLFFGDGCSIGKANGFFSWLLKKSCILWRPQN